MALSNLFGWNNKADAKTSNAAEQPAEQQTNRMRNRQHAEQLVVHLTNKKD